MRTDYARCGQGLRRSRACGEVAGDECHPACGPEYDQPRLGHRWPHDPSPRLCPEPAYPQAHRGGLWLDQSLGRFAVRPEGAYHQWREDPSRELSITLVADE